MIAEFTEVESGKCNDRKELQRALEVCKRERATLLVAKLDRLARNLHFITTLQASGVDFVACDQPHATRFVIHILCAVAEQEALAISQRTKDALRACKARGVKLGNPNPERAVKLAVKAKQERADSYAATLLPIIKDIQDTGQVRSLAGISRALNARGLQSPNGKAFTHATVKNIIARAA